ncbi:hypothetical protein [Streptosporangium carneum]|uniref:Tyr recombinase domain-containing protein n=1 Tax=Streptosporangium carneum TaxID=47481 RepID=A0A9W6I2Z6_9ACTN|nr:hypothetical protein [Streptosporangium carneum]GLK11085.1 hypothetical protein GCM10017600_44910 [Streptosporangium carneum]
MQFAQSYVVSRWRRTAPRNRETEAYALLSLIRALVADVPDRPETHESRSLRHRAKKETREIPTPPVLVAILREHIDAYVTEDDGWLLRTTRGGSYSNSACSYVWQEARALVFTDEQVRSPLAARPYDLRHAALSLWLNAGVPATEVAKRAGHSVEVLHRVYAKCMEGRQERMNGKIGNALGECFP